VLIRRNATDGGSKSHLCDKWRSGDNSLGISNAIYSSRFESGTWRFGFRSGGLGNNLTTSLLRFWRKHFCRVLSLLEGFGNSFHG
jgi:hypothetical protein